MRASRDLLSIPLEDLLDEALDIRRSAFGTNTTYSPKVFIPLTKLCRDKCGYCTFAQPPARVESPYLELDDVLAIARAGEAVGCHEALFTLGERPELRYPAAREWLDAHGYDSTLHYLAVAAQAVLDEVGLLPHANAGALYADELAALRPVSPSQGMMLESLNADLDCHRGAPDKAPERRLATLAAAGELQIPFTTGVLVGIGESRSDRLAALRAIADAHQQHGHVQEVIVQNFLPKAGTAMHAAPPCPTDEYLWTIAAARIILPSSIHLQAPPNLSEDFARLLDAGIDDWGGVSPVTADHVNPERPWPVLDTLRMATEARGLRLVPRLTIHPEFVRDPKRWLDPALHFAVLDRSDADGFARDHAWASGGDIAPPQLVSIAPPQLVSTAPPRPQASAAIRELLDAALNSEQLGVDELVTLFGARGPDVVAVTETADELRRRLVGDEVTFVSNRNINYTNICTFKCKFCAFSKGPLSLNLRGEPYLLGLDEIQRRVGEAVELGATEVCLQGGIHPSFDGDYYIDVCRAVHEVAPDIHIHGFTALEVTEGAKRLGEPLADYLKRLMAVGLKTLPGTAAEILDDEIRAVLCPDKINTEEWLEAHRIAHQVGLRSNVTIMFGAIERPVHWARHLVRTRELQRETGGFTEFVPLPFVHMAAPMYIQRKARRGPTFRESVLMHSVGRIAYAGMIDNIQVSWVKLGVSGARQLLCAGANDLGGTLIDENISRAAGAQHGQGMDAHAFAELVEPLGRKLVQRSTLYRHLATLS